MKELTLVDEIFSKWRSRAGRKNETLKSKMHRAVFFLQAREGWVYYIQSENWDPSSTAGASMKTLRLINETLANNRSWSKI